MTTLETADTADTHNPDSESGTRPGRTGTKLLSSPVAKVLGLTVGLGVILVVLLLVFILPSLKSGPRDLAVGVVGDPAAVASWDQGLETAAPGAFAPAEFETEQDLRAAIEARDIVGGFVLHESTVEVAVASAGSTAISSTLTSTAEVLADQAGQELSVVDVVPLPEGDPAGVGIGGLAFPLVFGGIVPAVAFRKFFPKSLGWAVAGMTTFAVIGGIAVAAVLMFVFGSIETAFWPVAAAMALGIAGLALPLAGLQEVFGGKGFTLGAMAMMFLGNPFAGIATTAAWLPAGFGLFGQILPPGAAGTLVRSAAYFGWSGALTAALTLAAWIAVGLVLLVIGKRRATRTRQAG